MRSMIDNSEGEEMCKNFGRLGIGIVSAIIVLGIGMSACSATYSTKMESTAAPEAVNANGGSGTSTSVWDIPPSDIPGVNGNQSGAGGQSNSASGSGVPQANFGDASTVHGIVNSFDITGMSITLDDDSTLYIQLGNARYTQSTGFAPAPGESVTVNGFMGNQAKYVAISVTLDSTGQTYSFRDASGRPLWAGGN